MQLQPGAIEIAKIWDVPIVVHWSFLIGGLLISAFTGFDLWETYFYCIAYFVLIVIHELGHVTAARLLGLKVHAVQISGFGGLCFAEPPSSLPGKLLYYAGGLLAQLLLLGFALLLVVAFGPPTSLYMICFTHTFTVINAILFLLNLLPLKTPRGFASDGYMLWKLLLHMVKPGLHTKQTSQDNSPVFDPNTSLLTIEGFRPQGFSEGIELLNDTTTPMEFVVSMLEKHMSFDRDAAITLMLDIHKQGGVLIPMPLETATQAASAITAEARTAGHKLVCRAVKDDSNQADR